MSDEKKLTKLCKALADVDTLIFDTLMDLKEYAALDVDTLVNPLREFKEDLIQLINDEKTGTIYCDDCGEEITECWCGDEDEDDEDDDDLDPQEDDGDDGLFRQAFGW